MNKLRPFVGDNPRIACASERTDPAFHSKYILDFLNGENNITDKFGRTLQGSDINALYIITKHDGLPIEDLLKHPIPKIIHFSITTLGGTKWEKGVMKYSDMLDRVKVMLDMGLDPDSVTIRIDPIVPGVTKSEDVEEVIKRSSEMGIKNIRFSIMDWYSTTSKYMTELGYDYSKYYNVNERHAKAEVRTHIENKLLGIAKKYGVTLSSCAEPATGSKEIKREGCLSVNAVNNMLGINLPQDSDKTKQRTFCSCFGGKTDLLRYDNKCASVCAYCYAHHNNDKILQYYNEDGTLKDIPLTRLSNLNNNTDQSNAITEETSEIKSFDNFIKEAGDAFDEVTVNKVKEDLNKQTTSRNTQPSFTFKDGTTVTTDFELNDQQKFALLELEKFFNSEETVFSLQGYAGTGKTTIMKVFDKYLNNRFFKPLYVSPTHKANAVTRANNPEALVKTIHSLLGLSPDYDVLKDSFDLSKIKFSSPSGINNTVQGTLIIVDESSMLEDSLADHLVEEAKKNNNRIIFIGDPAQLSPVGQTTESKALNYSGKVELTKVERTGDNAILKDATSLRENNTLSYITDLNDKGDGIIYTNKPATLDFFLKNIVNKNNFKNPLELRILTGENKYIPTYNKLIRNILFGENAPQLVKGDILMGYSNEKRTRDPRKPYEIINSGDYIVDEISDLTEKVVPYTDNKIKVFGYKVSLKNAYDNSNVDTFILDSNNNTNSIAASQIANLINGLWSKRSELISEGRRKEASKIIDIINSINNSFSTMFDVKDQYGKIIRYKTFDYAYTQTVHKSQGATYNNVVVLEDTFNKFSESEKQKLKYVALTRAKHKVLYYTSAKVNNRDITDVTSSKIKEMQNNAKRLSELGKERQNECK